MSSQQQAGRLHGPAFSYPEEGAARSEWILSARSAVSREVLPASLPAGFLWEDEWQGGNGLMPGLTVFLANRECPWRCLMCDLWRQSTGGRATADDILSQVDMALASRGGRRIDWIKLYNAGSFFDRGAIPPSAYEGLARRCGIARRAIVECHPSLVGPPVAAFRALLPTGTRLEVAMGLETANPHAHALLNKRTTPEDFAGAARWLRDRGIGVRLFLLTRPPFLAVEEAREWLLRSVDYALEIGGDPVVVIPTRGGNGAMERLRAAGAWDEAPLEWLEMAVRHGRSRRMGRVMADAWGLRERAAAVKGGFALVDRLEALNRGEEA